MEQVKLKYPEIEILRGDGNLWWGGAIRMGMAIGLQRNLKAVVWLNNDCLPDSGAVDKLVSASLKPNVGAVGGWCYTEGADRWGFNPGFIDFKPIPVYDLEKYDFLEVHGLNGNFVSVNMNAVSSVGLPRNDLYSHYMDGPYTYLIRKSGFKLQVATRIRASLSRDLERSIGVFDYCSIWQARYLQKLRYFFSSRRSAHHLKDKFQRIRTIRGPLLALPIYIMSSVIVFVQITLGTFCSVLFPKPKIIERVTLKYQKEVPANLLREALLRLGRRKE